MRVAVTYHVSRAGDAGELRFLDTTTGRLYVSEGAFHHVGAGYAPTGAHGEWSNVYGTIRQVGPTETAAPTSPWDTQEGGSHYKGLTIQPMQYSLANKLDAAQHTAIKYITRFRDKGGIADLRKAIHSIELLIAHEESINGK